MITELTTLLPADWPTISGGTRGNPVVILDSQENTQFTADRLMEVIVKINEIISVVNGLSP